MSLHKNFSLPLIFDSKNDDLLKQNHKTSPSLEIQKKHLISLHSQNDENEKFHNQILQIFERVKTDEIKTNNIITTKSSHKYINIPDFYIGTSLKKATSQYHYTELMDKYKNSLKFINEIDSKKLKLSREAYYSGFEQDILTSLKSTNRRSSRQKFSG